MRTVNMLDLRGEFAIVGDDVRAAIEDVLASQRFIGGPPVERLESAVAERCAARHGVAVSSGTDALLATLMALDIHAGDEVILPSLTFFATAGSVYRVGATPVFVDIDPRTFNIDPDAIEAAITDRTKAVIVVHLFGQCADMDRITAIARRHGVTFIEDAAQAIGATFRDQRAGGFGDAACFSFYPTKNLGGFGEGGMVLTGDDDLAASLRRLRNQGQSERYIHDRVGGNFRLDAMKAAILLAKLGHLDAFTERRRCVAKRYDERLADAGVTTPFVPPSHRPVYHQYSILCDRRDELAAYLSECGVQTAVYYPVPLHRQRCFAGRARSSGALDMTEKTCDTILSLPCHPMLSDEDVDHVASCVREFCQRHAESCAASGRAGAE